MNVFKPFIDYIFRDDCGNPYPHSSLRKKKFIDLMERVLVNGEPLWQPGKYEATTIISYETGNCCFHVSIGNLIYRYLFVGDIVTFFTVSREDLITVYKRETLEFRCPSKDVLKHIVAHMFDIPVGNIYVPDDVNMYL